MIANTIRRNAGQEDPAPFWERIPRFFLFPLHLTIFGRIALAAAIPVLCFLAPGIVSGLVLFVGGSLWAWISLLRQGSRVLIETSRGRLSPAQYDSGALSGLGGMPFAILALFFLSGVALGIAQALIGNAGAMALNFVITLMMPAALMVLVHKRSLLAGLNPLQAAALISGIGKAYLLLCVFLFCLSSAQMFLTWQLFSFGLQPLIEGVAEIHANLDGEQKPLELFASLFEGQHARLASALFCANLAAMYFTMIAFNMMGYVLYQYHHNLGITIADQPGADDADTGNDSSAQIAALIADGRIDQALDIAYEEQRLAPDDIATNERYHKLLHLAGRNDRLTSHAERLIRLLLSKGMNGKAVDTLRRCRAVVSDFRPANAADEVALAHAAHEQRDARLALDLLRAFDKRHRNHALIPEVYFLSARILCEEFRQDATAEKIFAAITRRYPGHPLAEQASVYLGTLRRLRTDPA